MRECPACGTANGPTDDFCGNCGTYLGWSDPASVRDPAPAPDPAAVLDPTPAPDPAPGAAPSPVDSAPPPVPDPTVGPPPDGPPAPAGGTPGGANPPPPAVPTNPPPPPIPQAPPAVSGPHTPGSSPPDAPARPDRAGDPPAVTAPPPPPAAPSPVAPSPATPPTAAPPPATPPTAAPPPAAPPPTARAPQPPAPEPIRPVKPAKAVAARPVVRPAAPAEDVAGVPCPTCRTPNPPGRRFCRRCAATLTTTAAPAPLPWWRRIWPFRRGARAGSGRLVRLLVILVVVLALGVAGFLFAPTARDLYEDTRDKLGKAKAVTPASIEASSELPGHPAENTTDGLTDRYWATPEAGATVTYTFSQAFRLVDVIITNGASASPEDYARQGRALQIEMEVTTPDGAKHHKSFTLSDKPGPQTIPTGISDTKSIRLTLTAPVGLTEDRHLALAEVEFFRRS